MERAVQTPIHEAHPAYVTQDLVPRLLARCCRAGVVADREARASPRSAPRCSPTRKRPFRSSRLRLVSRGLGRRRRRDRLGRREDFVRGLGKNVAHELQFVLGLLELGANLVRLRLRQLRAVGDRIPSALVVTSHRLLESTPSRDRLRDRLAVASSDRLVALPGLADRAEKRARHGVSELGEIAGDCSAWEDESRSGAHDASTVMRSQSPPEPKATPRAQSSAEYRRGAGMLERGLCDTIRPGFASCSGALAGGPPSATMRESPRVRHHRSPVVMPRA
jgi:hypothetical protein